tara:strand:- start:215 stop:487 length:273 start_codon:yes stop_codon:yes gene_type:complete
MDENNPLLEETVTTDTGLKQLVVNYIGNKLDGPEEITVDMAVQVFAEEFPEFLLPVAEENFLRGYEQALMDVENHQQQLAEAATGTNESS